MFNRKTDYALNKKNPQAILYQDAYGNITELTEADFESKEAFQTWKAWLEDSSHVEEKADHIYQNHVVSLHGLEERIPSADFSLDQSAEQKEREQRAVALLGQIRENLSSTQYRRLWMYHVDKLTVREIASREGISFQCVHRSILAAEKKIFIFLKKQGDKTP